MPDLLIPDSVAHERVNAQMERQASFDMEEAKRWTEELKRIDPTLEVAWVPEQATEFDYPGRWHVRKVLPDEYDEWWPLLRGAVGGTPADGYIGPGSWILDVFSANDMWNPRVHRSKREAKAKLREAKRRAKAREQEQRRDEMALAHRAANRIKDDGGLRKRTDLLLPPALAAERKAKREAEGIRPK